MFELPRFLILTLCDVGRVNPSHVLVAWYPKRVDKKEEGRLNSVKRRRCWNTKVERWLEVPHEVDSYIIQ